MTELCRRLRQKSYYNEWQTALGELDDCREEKRGLQLQSDSVDNRCATLESQVDELTATNRYQQERITTLEAKAAQLVYRADRQVLITSLQGNEIWVPVDKTAVALRDGRWVRKVMARHGADALERLPMDEWDQPHYRIPPVTFTIDYLAFDLTDKKKYELSLKRVFDCDKFTRVLWGKIADMLDGAWNHSGFTDDFSGGHAFFAFLGIRPEFFFFDEETGFWIDLGEQPDGSDGEFFGEEPQTDNFWVWDREAMTGMYDAEQGKILI